MFDDSAKYQKLNSLALENGHLENYSGKPKYLFSIADSQQNLNPENTRSIPAIGYTKHEPCSSLFFSAGMGNSGIQNENIIKLNTNEQGQIDKTNTRHEREFLEKQEQKEEKHRYRIPN